MKLKNAGYTPTELTLGDATLLIADQGDLHFTGMDWPDRRIIWTDGSTEAAYIPDGEHMLPADAALPLLHRTNRWACPTSEKFDAVRKLIEQTSAVGQIAEPGWERIRRMVGFHLGGHQPANTPLPETRIQWWQENAPSNLGYQRRRGWYFGVLPGRDANGWSNWHYNRIFWMTVALCYEQDHRKREEAWPHYVQQAVAHTCLGREWSGPFKGMAKGEKGDVYIGIDSRGMPTRKYEKDWVTNLVGPWLLTGQDLFKKALDNASTFYANLPLTAWQGAWGARIPARIIENMLQLDMLGYSMDGFIRDWLNHVGNFLYRTNWLWPNIGNRGAAPESPWMQSELCAVILRVWEQIPSLKDVGVTRQEVVNVMHRVMEMIPNGGSDLVGSYWCLKYRYHTPTTDPMYARFLSNTAFALPALRMLQKELPSQYENCRNLVMKYAGSEIVDARAGKPRPITSIGYRDPTTGPAAPKVWCSWMEAVR